MVDLRRAWQSVLVEVKTIKDRSLVANLKRYREPVAWTSLAIIASGQAIGLVRMVWQIAVARVSVFAAFQTAGNSLMSLQVALLQLALVWACLFIAPSTRRAVQVTHWSAWVITVGAMLTLLFTVLGLASSRGVFLAFLEFFGGILDFVLKALPAGALWLIHRAVTAGRLGIADGEDDEDADATSPDSPPIWEDEDDEDEDDENPPPRHAE